MSVASVIRGYFPISKERTERAVSEIDRKKERRIISPAQFASMSHDDLIEYGQALKYPTVSTIPSEETSRRLMQLRQQLEDFSSKLSL